MIVKPSIAFEDMRKSAGGVTASKNKARLYLKNRISPRNPRSDAQTKVRATLTTFAKNWAVLTPEQRDAWNEAAKSVMGVRILGNAAKISGFNLYVRINSNLDMIGKEAIQVPGTGAEFAPFDIVSIAYVAAADQNSAKLNVTFSGIESLTAQTLVIRATPGFSQGRESYPALLRNIGVFTEISAGVVDIATKYQAVLGAFPASGQKIQIEAFLVDNATGEASLKQSLTYLFE